MANNTGASDHLPVGRIDFLGFNGKVKESIEYADAEKFLHDIKEENYYGTPMCIFVYRNKDGHTIPLGFMNNLDPPPQGFKVISYEHQLKTYLPAEGAGTHPKKKDEMER